VSSLDQLFAPQSIAVVGASNNAEKAGYQMMAVLESSDLSLFPVNPKENEILGYQAFPTLVAIGKRVDLAIFTLPAGACVSAMHDAVAAGVGSVMIISGGFSESGDEGKARQDEIVELCETHNIRLLGPNTSGFIAPGKNLQATFVPGLEDLPPGHMGIIAQSGAINVTLAALARDLNIGVRLAVGVGNGQNTSAADLIDYLAEDEETHTIAVYLEGVADGRHLYDAVRSASQKKPVIVMAIGRSDVGDFAASHTGNLIGSFELKIAALKQAGAIVVDTTRELMSVAKCLGFKRLPPQENPGVALVTGQAGPGMIISDYLKHRGVTMPNLGNGTMSEIAQLLPPMTFIKNPVDTGRPGSTFAPIVDLVLADQAISAVLIFALHEPAAIAPSRLFAEISNSASKPIIFGTAGPAALLAETAQTVEPLGIPVITNPDEAATCMMALVEDSRRQYHLNLSRERSIGSDLPIIDSRSLNEHEAKVVLETLGIPCPNRRLAHTHESALESFSHLKKPIALKIIAADILHKTEVGGVCLNIKTVEELHQGLTQIDAIDTQEKKAYLLESMADNGIEVILGGKNDQSFGPTVLLGLGGTTAEALGDISMRLAPLSERDALEMIGELKGSELLQGWRGAPQVDIEALARALITIGDFIVANPQLGEIDLNPVRLYPKGLLALDALIIPGAHQQLHTV
jgi:acyl-CoA synthetase (NDP forming)